jgi:hypothetical protein
VESRLGGSPQLGDSTKNEGPDPLDAKCTSTEKLLRSSIKEME